MKRRLILLSIFLLVIHSSFAQTWQWQTVKPGRYAVGYKTINIKDAGRPYSVSPLTPRVLPLHIWYPALKSTRAAMKFIDYVKSDQNASWGRQMALQILTDNVKQNADSAMVPKLTKAITNITTASIKNAAVMRGKFPVVLFGNGLTAPGFYYTLMAEYLASYGYVVVEFPSMPENSSMPKFGFNERGILNQVNDTELALNGITRLPFVDVEKLGLISWSVGGASQIVFQMKDKAAKAIVSLDAASQYQYGKDLIKNSVYYDSTKFNTPLLNLTAGGPSRFVVPRSKFFFDTLASSKQQFTFLKLAHGNCLAFYEYIAWLDKHDEAIKSSYERMCEITRLFLDDVILNDPGAKRKLHSLSPEIN